MTTEIDTKSYQPMTSFMGEDLFKLQCLIKATEIQHSAQCEYKKKLFLAFTTGNAEIFLYYKKDPTCAPTIKRIPWFQGSHNQIAALCFHPAGSWLLAASVDGSVYIIPALCLVDENYEMRGKWAIDDITSFPSISSQSSCSKPTAIVWWEDRVTAAAIGIIGTEYGEIVSIYLETGEQINVTHVDGNIVSLHICCESNDIVSLLITSQSEQWRLLLQQHTYSCLHYIKSGEYNGLHMDDNICDNASGSTRSRLQGLKQLSVEKLTVLREKLIETKSRTLEENLQNHDTTSDLNTHNTTVKFDSFSEVNQNQITPLAMSKDEFLVPQSDREGRQLYTCFHSDSNCITVLGPQFSGAPLSAHKVFESCQNVLLTQRFLFITDASQRVMYVISDRLSDTSKKDNCEFNPECIVGHFSLVDSKEVIRAVYRAIDFTDDAPTLSQDIKTEYIIPKEIKDMEVALPPVDTCIIVTNQSVYKVVLRKSLLSFFMEIMFSLKDNRFEKAAKLATIFGIDSEPLLEAAGDILLSNNQFSHAMGCYKEANSKILKSVLKCASVGSVPKLLICLKRYLASALINKLDITTKIHLSNLCVLAFIETILRVPPQNRVIDKEFLHFLSTNSFYSEVLVMNVAAQTCLWEVLHNLATQKCLYGQMLEVLMNTVHPSATINFHPSPYGSLVCISEQSLMQAMLVNPLVAKGHMSFVLHNLQDLQTFVLERLVTLYNPTNPVIRPKIVRCRLRHRTTSHSSQSSQCDSIDLVENEEADTLVEEIIETFLLILLTLIHKKSILRKKPLTTCNIELLGIKKAPNNTNSIADFKRRPLSAGYYHVVLVRNGNLYTWGTSVQGCLGIGQSLRDCETAKPITFFRRMEVEVLSVSCGSSHTLAVTNNGVYVWGSNKLGQLGLGKILQCSSPELIVSLADEVIVDAVAGQYHSVALTADGRVFTWGWGVYGQLGHGDTEKKMTPALVMALLGTDVCSISAGHAHTLVLSREGIVYAFGCNSVGQLGMKNTKKSLVPLKVWLSHKITLIATGYFHNLAVSDSNKLYMWGASPHAYRQQKQTTIQKRNREAMLKRFAHLVVYACDEVPEDNAQPKTSEDRKPETASHDEKLDHRHKKPDTVDTHLVQGDIVQISAGCHHSALVTKDGSLYTWGRNSDGQIGNGSKKDVAIPTPLNFNPASVFAQVPPRRKSCKPGEDEEFDGAKGNKKEKKKAKKIDNPVIKTVGVSCGYDYTVAIQPGGTILAWGNNTRAQLGHIPTTHARDMDDKFISIKKRVLRIPNATHEIIHVPSQVPFIPAPTISYQSYDILPLAGLIPPLSNIESSPDESTLHYALEYFFGLYDSSTIMEKCIQLGNYQACSKIAMLQHNISDAFLYQLKILHALSPQSCEVGKNNRKVKSERKSSSSRHVEKNTELFNEQVEKNLIDSVEDCAVKNKMKIPASKSLNSLQLLQQELNTFDCQGGSEELCKDMKYENTPLGVFEGSSDGDINSSDSEERVENIVQEDNQLQQGGKVTESIEDNSVASTLTKEEIDESLCEKKIAQSRLDNVSKEAIKVIKFFLTVMENETNTVKYKVLQDAVVFWIEHDLPMQSIKNVFVEHMQSIFYPLGLLLFCQGIMEKYLDTNKNDVAAKRVIVVNYFSVKFCLQVCSMLLNHIDQGEPTPEFIQLLSSLTADHYGPPLTGYPGSTENSTSKQMLEGVISTLSSGAHDSRSFVHIKDPDAVYQFLTTEEDTMVFTCGHYFPLTAYKTDVIPTMVTELLTSNSLVLPCTAQYLEKMYLETSKPEIVCPTCIPRALGTLVKKNE